MAINRRMISEKINQYSRHWCLLINVKTRRYGNFFTNPTISELDEPLIGKVLNMVRKNFVSWSLFLLLQLELIAALKACNPVHLISHPDRRLAPFQFIEWLRRPISDVHFTPKLMTTSGDQFECDLVIINHQTVPMSAHSALLIQDRSVGEFDDNLKNESARLVNNDWRPTANSPLRG